MRILSIGAHIGDPELMAGPYLCQKILEGHDCSILALTAGELGNPDLEPDKYRNQKLAESREFERRSGIRYEVFSEYADAALYPTEELVHRVENLILETGANEVITHWRGSFHPDHRAAHDIVSKAILRIHLNRGVENAVQLKYAENWEDADSFRLDEAIAISEGAFELWKESIEHEEFIYGNFSSFRYLDYYTALMTVRGCINGSSRAVAHMKEKVF